MFIILRIIYDIIWIVFYEFRMEFCTKIRSKGQHFFISILLSVLKFWSIFGPHYSPVALCYHLILTEGGILSQIFCTNYSLKTISEQIYSIQFQIGRRNIHCSFLPFPQNKINKCFLKSILWRLGSIQVLQNIVEGLKVGHITSQCLFS